MIEKLENYCVLEFYLYKSEKEKIKAELDSSDDNYHYSDDDLEEIENVDFHTEGDDSVVIKNITTQDPFLTKLCSARVLFRGHVEFGVNEETPQVDPDDNQIDPVYKCREMAKQLCNYFDHEGGLIEHYAKLYQYRQALLDSNPGSTCTLDVVESDNGSVSFKRMYICFSTLMKDGMVYLGEGGIGLASQLMKTQSHQYKEEVRDTQGEQRRLEVKTRMLQSLWCESPATQVWDNYVEDGLNDVIPTFTTNNKKTNIPEQTSGKKNSSPRRNKWGARMFRGRKGGVRSGGSGGRGGGRAGEVVKVVVEGLEEVVMRGSTLQYADTQYLGHGPEVADQEYEEKNDYFNPANWPEESMEEALCITVT
ncbi:hypothetical protein Tco_1108646 [Tanacetum coccineum]